MNTNQLKRGSSGSKICKNMYIPKDPWFDFSTKDRDAGRTFHRLDVYPICEEDNFKNK